MKDDDLPDPFPTDRSDDFPLRLVDPAGPERVWRGDRFPPTQSDLRACGVNVAVLLAADGTPLSGRPELFWIVSDDDNYEYRGDRHGRQVCAQGASVCRPRGLCLSGGPNRHPACYDAEPHPALGPTEPRLDHFEIALVRAAEARDMPVLAICRGLQVLNVSRGGTLTQDLPSQRPSEVEHRQPQAASSSETLATP